jgi:hypothetical protein
MKAIHSIGRPAGPSPIVGVAEDDVRSDTIGTPAAQQPFHGLGDIVDPQVDHRTSPRSAPGAVAPARPGKNSSPGGSNIAVGSESSSIA